MAPFTSRRLVPLQEPSIIEHTVTKISNGVCYLCLMGAFFSFLYCILPHAKAQELTFVDILPERSIFIPFGRDKPKPAEPKTEKQKMLASACETFAPGDHKCPCINNAVFKHDSSWATEGVGAKTNNPGNMRIPATWKPSVPLTVYRSPGNGVFARFKTLEDGIKANVELYARFYKDLSAKTLVDRWADGGGNSHYRGAVKACYAA